LAAAFSQAVTWSKWLIDLRGSDISELGVIFITGAGTTCAGNGAPLSTFVWCFLKVSICYRTTAKISNPLVSNG
jgi:hypothetical protein